MMDLKCTKDFCGILKKLGFFRVLKIAEKIRCYLFWNIFFVEVSLRLSFSAGPQGNAWFVAAFFHSWLQQTLTLTRARLHTHTSAPVGSTYTLTGPDLNRKSHRPFWHEGYYKTHTQKHTSWRSHTLHVCWCSPKGSSRQGYWEMANFL